MTTNEQNSKHNNPFFEKTYQTPHQTIPFNEINIADYEPAFMEGIKQDNELIESIINNPEEPTCDNTIAYSVPDNLLSRVSNAFFNLLSAETNDEMDELAQKMSPILTEHSNNILFNQALFARIKTVYEHHRELTTEEQTLLDKTYESFVRNGANLTDDKKEQLRELNKELSKLTLQFSQNVLKEINNYELHLTNEDDLKGLPETAVEAAALAAKEKNKSGWVFTLHGQP